MNEVVAFDDKHSDTGVEIVHPLLNVRLGLKGMKANVGTYMIIVLSTPTRESFYQAVLKTEAADVFTPSAGDGDDQKAQPKGVKVDVNLKFQTIMKVMYKFEMVQPMRFSLYNVPDPNADIFKIDCIGQADIDVSLLAYENNKTHKLPIFMPNETSPIGEFLVISQQSLHCGALLYTTMELKKLKIPKNLGSVKPFFAIYRVTHIVPPPKPDINNKRKKGHNLKKVLE